MNLDISEQDTLLKISDTIEKYGFFETSLIAEPGTARYYRLMRSIKKLDPELFDIRKRKYVFTKKGESVVKKLRKWREQ